MPRPIIPVDAEGFKRWSESASALEGNWAQTCGFTGASGQSCLVPDNDGGLAKVLCGLENPDDPWALAHLPEGLPAGEYAIEGPFDARQRRSLALGFELARYRFDRYKEQAQPPVQLLLSSDDQVVLSRLVGAVSRVRDLVNTPAEDMGPADLGDHLAALAEEYGGDYRDIVGDDLLAANLPAIHAVGRAAHQAPRLLMLTWGEPDHPALTLVGKGVCFDSGGLDIKSAAGMRIMKKDMGGAAHAMALGAAVMDAGLKVRLQVLIPAVENAISGNAYRPGDIVHTRAGLSVEIGNTDAEGRVVLCDALKLACEARPDLVMDFATLTGAARIALGPDLPALFGNTDEVVQGLLASGRRCHDPYWQMPLHPGYDSYLDSTVADLGNVADTSFAGCITAALYLQRFVEPDIPWCHVDVYAWNQRARPGRPAGGEAQGLRAAYDYLAERFG